MRVFIGGRFRRIDGSAGGELFRERRDPTVEVRGDFGFAKSTGHDQSYAVNGKCVKTFRRGKYLGGADGYQQKRRIGGKKWGGVETIFGESSGPRDYFFGSKPQ